MSTAAVRIHEKKLSPKATQKAGFLPAKLEVARRKTFAAMFVFREG